MSDTVWLFLNASLLAFNVVTITLNIRSIRAYYRAHDLLWRLCLQAWILRHRRELFSIYEESLGRFREQGK